jgi:hypothetical protein
VQRDHDDVEAVQAGDVGGARGGVHRGGEVVLQQGVDRQRVGAGRDGGGDAAGGRGRGGRGGDGGGGGGGGGGRLHFDRYFAQYRGRLLCCGGGRGRGEARGARGRDGGTAGAFLVAGVVCLHILLKPLGRRAGALHLGVLALQVPDAPAEVL